MPTQPTLRHVCDLHVELAEILELGTGRAGHRRIIPIVGGTAIGPAISGKVLGIGADWQTVFRDGVANIDTRYAIETHDEALIEVRNQGYRHGPPEVIARLAAGEECDPSEYYMHTTARLETGDKRYLWVNGTVFVGTGARYLSSVHISLFAVE